MDLTQDVTYRGFLLNDSAVRDNLTYGGTGTGIIGCVIDTGDYSDVDVVQYTEKRSQGDGHDAGVPYLGMRRIRLAGTLYGLTRAGLYDALNELRAAVNPVLSYREEPLDYGYQPLYFSQPTERTDADEYPSGQIDLRILCMPRAFQAMFNRDAQGGVDTNSLAIPWQATLIAKDPGIQAAAYSDVDLTTGNTVAGSFNNRGNYLAPLNMLIATTSASGTITVTAGDSQFTITVPASTGNRTIRVKEDKVITFEEDNVEVPKMGSIAFANDTTWPLISPGASAYSVVFSSSAMRQTGSLMWFYERYA